MCAGMPSHIYYRTFTHMNKNTIQGKSKFYKAFQEPSTLQRGMLSIMSSLAHALPIAMPPPTPPPPYPWHTHTLHKGYLGHSGSNPAGRSQGGPRTEEVSRGGFLGKTWRRKKPYRLVLSSTVQGQNQKSWIVQNPQGKFQNSRPEMEERAKKEQEITEWGRKSKLRPRWQPIRASQSSASTAQGESFTSVRSHFVITKACEAIIFPIFEVTMKNCKHTQYRLVQWTSLP